MPIELSDTPNPTAQSTEPQTDGDRKRLSRKHLARRNRREHLLTVACNDRQLTVIWLSDGRRPIETIQRTRGSDEGHTGGRREPGRPGTGRMVRQDRVPQAVSLPQVWIRTDEKNRLWATE